MKMIRIMLKLLLVIISHLLWGIVSYLLWAIVLSLAGLLLFLATLLMQIRYYTADQTPKSSRLLRRLLLTVVNLIEFSAL